MKHFLALAASAGILVWGCARRPQAQGGTFDTTVFEPHPAKTQESGLRYSPPGRQDWRKFQGHSQGDTLRGGDDSDGDSDMLLPRHRNEMLTI